MSTTQPFYNIQKSYEWILNRKWDWRKYITYINNIIHHSLILIGICFKKGIPHNLHSQIESFLYNCSSFELAANYSIAQTSDYNFHFQSFSAFIRTTACFCASAITRKIRQCFGRSRGSNPCPFTWEHVGSILEQHCWYA